MFLIIFAITAQNVLDFITVLLKNYERLLTYITAYAMIWILNSVVAYKFIYSSLTAVINTHDIHVQYSQWTQCVWFSKRVLKYYTNVQYSQWTQCAWFSKRVLKYYTNIQYSQWTQCVWFSKRVLKYMYYTNV